MTRKNIFIIWILGSIPLMLVTAVISMLVWNYTYQADPAIPLRPINHIFDMSFRVPVGWFLSFLTPFGWANIVLLGLSLYTKSSFLLTGSAIATILAGIWWPSLYITMMNL